MNLPTPYCTVLPNADTKGWEEGRRMGLLLHVIIAHLLLVELPESDSHSYLFFQRGGSPSAPAVLEFGLGPPHLPLPDNHSSLQPQYFSLPGSLTSHLV